MTVTLPVGFVPLVDAAPLIIAAELDFAGGEGLHLDLHRAASWSMLRDMLDFGQVDAAHMLSVVPVAKALGLGGGVSDMEALMVLSLNGQVLGISSRLAARLQDTGLPLDFQDAKAAGNALLSTGQRLRIGTPFPFSMHTELLHYWLESLGLSPEAAPLILTVPPPLMADALAADEIDVFCVGEPWGSDAVERAGAVLLLPGSAIWSQAPEKVLATRAGWAAAHPDLVGPLIRALWRAGRWLADPGNHIIASEILARKGFLDVSADLIDRALTGRILTAGGGAEVQVPQFVEFHAGAANFPWRSQAAWIAARLAARHGLDPGPAMDRARTTFRSDLYRQHLDPEGVLLPAASDKAEGLLDRATTVPAVRGTLILERNRFFDGRKFDPALPV
jgi:two-component system, oxyanion-binding sensor